MVGWASPTLPSFTKTDLQAKRTIMTEDNNSHSVIKTIFVGVITSVIATVLLYHLGYVGNNSSGITSGLTRDRPTEKIEHPTPSNNYSSVVGKWSLTMSGHYEILWKANFYLNGDELEGIAKKENVNEQEISKSEKQTTLKINGRFYGLEFKGDSEERNSKNQTIYKKVYFKFSNDLTSFTGGLTTDGNEDVFNIKGRRTID